VDAVRRDRVGGGELHSGPFARDRRGPAVRLGDGSCLDLSPDGRWALASISPTRIDVLPCGARLATDDSALGHRDSQRDVVPDGESICVLGLEGGGGARLFKVDAITGKCEPFSEEGISSYEILVHPDGKSVAARARTCA
jgi:hypothetical protein